MVYIVSEVGANPITCISEFSYRCSCQYTQVKPELADHMSRRVDMGHNGTASFL